MLCCENSYLSLWQRKRLALKKLVGPGYSRNTLCTICTSVSKHIRCFHALSVCNYYTIHRQMKLNALLEAHGGDLGSDLGDLERLVPTSYCYWADRLWSSSGSAHAQTRLVVSVCSAHGKLNRVKWTRVINSKVIRHSWKAALWAKCSPFLMHSQSPILVQTGGQATRQEFLNRRYCDTLLGCGVTHV